MVQKHREAIMHVCFRHPPKRPPSLGPDLATPGQGYLNSALGFDLVWVFKRSLLPKGELSDFD